MILQTYLYIASMLSSDEFSTIRRLFFIFFNLLYVYSYVHLCWKSPRLGSTEIVVNETKPNVTINGKNTTVDDYVRYLYETRQCRFTARLDRFQESPSQPINPSILNEMKRLDGILSSIINGSSQGSLGSSQSSLGSSQDLWVVSESLGSSL